MSAERIYRLLLRAYPPDFRAEYGREMVLVFRDQCRESDVRTIGFWAAVIWDIARSAPALRAEAWWTRGRESTRTTGVIMKLAAMLTVLVGVFGILNAMVEWGAALTGTIGGMHALALVLGVLASALLLAAGAAILRPTPRGRQAARLALLVSFLPIPRNQDADFIKHLQHYRHDHLRENFRRRQQCAKDQIDDDHVAAHGFQLLVIENADFHQRQQHNSNSNAGGSNGNSSSSSSSYISYSNDGSGSSSCLPFFFFSFLLSLFFSFT